MVDWCANFGGREMVAFAAAAAVLVVNKTESLEGQGRLLELNVGSLGC